MCEVTEGLINKGVEQGRKEMQPKVDAAEARAKKAEAETAEAKKKTAKAEAENAKLKEYILSIGGNPNIVAE